MIFADSFLPWFLEPAFLLGALQAAAGLGLLIFVHELGHFAVAKWCGVQCDKFMIGFDIGGYKLSHKWGETVYGIGILPLGGYVKMLGQDDDPNQIAEQMEKSQVQADEDGVEVSGPGGQKYVVDRRSYLAKSVPQRMAIISAGVIMNVIFAFIFAFIAFGVGVPEMPCTVSQTAPGSPAWEADLRTGDHIQEIAGIENPSFQQLTGKVMLANLDEGVPLVISTRRERFAANAHTQTKAAEWQRHGQDWHHQPHVVAIGGRVSHDPWQCGRESRQWDSGRRDSEWIPRRRRDYPCQRNSCNEPPRVDFHTSDASFGSAGSHRAAWR